jgi:hypothetical protein
MHEIEQRRQFLLPLSTNEGLTDDERGAEIEVVAVDVDGELDRRMEEVNVLKHDQIPLPQKGLGRRKVFEAQMNKFNLFGTSVGNCRGRFLLLPLVLMFLSKGNNNFFCAR